MVPTYVATAGVPALSGALSGPVGRRSVLCAAGQRPRGVVRLHLWQRRVNKSSKNGWPDGARNSATGTRDGAAARRARMQ
jgi:hypothetical protein